MKRHLKYIVLLLALTLAALAVLRYGLKYPIPADLGAKGDITLECAYVDTRGYIHTGTVGDKTATAGLSGLLKRIDGERPKRVFSAGQYDGAFLHIVTVMSGEKEALALSLQGKFLTVGRKGSVLRRPTIYELNEASANELRELIRSFCE